MKSGFLIVLCLPLMSVSAIASELALKLEIPQLNVAEYHRPYVAIWLERPDQKFVANLAVLYDVKKKNLGGTKYLKDLRQWWRKSGHEVTMPLDGVSGATRAPGEHVITFPGAKAQLDQLPAGDYELVVEAARESGGRDLVRMPLHWPLAATQTIAAKGKEELGNLLLQLKP